MVIFLVFATSIGMNLVFHKDIIKRLEGYHCQPITTHSTIEEAKAKVREYQGNES